MKVVAVGNVFFDISNVNFTIAFSSNPGAPPPTPAEITSPAPGSTLRATTAMFQWTGGIGVSLRYLQVGTTLGGGELYNADPGAASSTRQWRRYRATGARCMCASGP